MVTSFPSNINVDSETLYSKGGVPNCLNYTQWYLALGYIGCNTVCKVSNAVCKGSNTVCMGT